MKESSEKLTSSYILIYDPCPRRTGYREYVRCDVEGLYHADASFAPAGGPSTRVNDLFPRISRPTYLSHAATAKAQDAELISGEALYGRTYGHSRTPR